ncbi:hypothetical protein [Bartonella rattaustraliani]|uniref:hypothetical protein n=1 Tax=Bartonella rattaustraliani TaxID=481139 RepID=UPI0002D8582B|nr:hypothetical protein [Bartonella rattaustraliani]
MARKQNNQEKELTDKEQELLHEMINTYQVVKVMSRFMRWLAFAVLLFVIDLSRMLDALENVILHLKVVSQELGGMILFL